MENIQIALDNFTMWLGWYPADYAGAVAQASCFLDTVAEVDEFQSRLKAMAEGGAA